MLPCSYRLTTPPNPASTPFASSGGPKLLPPDSSTCHLSSILHDFLRLSGSLPISFLPCLIATELCQRNSAISPRKAPPPMPMYRPKCEPLIRNSRNSSKSTRLCCPELLSVKVTACSETLLAIPVNYFLLSLLFFKTTVTCRFFSTAFNAISCISGTVCWRSSLTEVPEDVAKNDRISTAQTVLKSMCILLSPRGFRAELLFKPAGCCE